MSQEKSQPSALEWEAPVRVFKARDRRYFAQLGTLLLLVCLVLLFFKQWLLTAVIVALFFLIYVLSTVPPHSTKHRITAEGVTTGGKAYLWEELGEFYFTRRHEQTVLNVRTKAFPGRLSILLESVEEDKVKEALSSHLSFREAAPIFWMDRLTDWLAKKLKLE